MPNSRIPVICPSFACGTTRSVFSAVDGDCSSSSRVQASTSQRAASQALWADSDEAEGTAVGGAALAEAGGGAALELATSPAAAPWSATNAKANTAPTPRRRQRRRPTPRPSRCPHPKRTGTAALSWRLCGHPRTHVPGTSRMVPSLGQTAAPMPSAIAIRHRHTHTKAATWRRQGSSRSDGIKRAQRLRKGPLD